ncbi:MAG: glucose-6-phosphate dehydrogenase assembly protein OpcA [Frankiaceae bacterium]
MTTLWDTTGTDVVKALAAERRAAGAVAFAGVLTLIVVADERHVGQAEAAATTAASAHPCRLLLVVRRQLEAPSRLDAEVSIGGRLGPGEAVVMRMYGRLTLHAESVVLPLLAPDAPVVTWWNTTPPDQIAYDPLGVLADRRVTDSAAAPDPLDTLRQRAQDYAPGDTDIAWARLTWWRGLLASAMDGVESRPARVVVSASGGNPSAALLTGWLGARLGIPIEWEEVAAPGMQALTVQMPGGDELALSRHDDRTARLTRLGHPDRLLQLTDRDLGELLAEELRRLDADEPYSEALSHWSGIDRLEIRSPKRTHIWRDPEQERRAEVAG